MDCLGMCHTNVVYKVTSNIYPPIGLTGTTSFMWNVLTGKYRHFVSILRLLSHCMNCSLINTKREARSPNSPITITLSSLHKLNKIANLKHYYTMNVKALALSASPPSPKRKGRSLDHIGLQPIELINGCTEDGCSIESDDPHLTNLVRLHFLQHFGHRDLKGIVSDYTENAVMVNVVNGERKSYHGHDEIQRAFKEIFELHPTVDSTFQLKNIAIHDSEAMVVWSATTPTKSFPESSDTIMFDSNGKISKQFFRCEINNLDTPWYVDDN